MRSNLGLSWLILSAPPPLNDVVQPPVQDGVYPIGRNVHVEEVAQPFSFRIAQWQTDRLTFPHRVFGDKRVTPDAEPSCCPWHSACQSGGTLYRGAPG